MRQRADQPEHCQQILPYVCFITAGNSNYRPRLHWVRLVATPLHRAQHPLGFSRSSDSTHAQIPTAIEISTAANCSSAFFSTFFPAFVTTDTNHNVVTQRIHTYEFREFKMQLLRGLFISTANRKTAPTDANITTTERLTIGGVHTIDRGDGGGGDNDDYDQLRYQKKKKNFRGFWWSKMWVCVSVYAPAFQYMMCWLRNWAYAIYDVRLKWRRIGLQGVRVKGVARGQQYGSGGVRVRLRPPPVQLALVKRPIFSSPISPMIGFRLQNICKTRFPQSAGSKVITLRVDPPLCNTYHFAQTAFRNIY